MNSRPVVLAAASLLGITFYLTQRATKRDQAEFNARLAQVEEQVQRVNQPSELEQLKAENGRLQAENRRLRATLEQVKTTASGEPIRVSHQQPDQGYDPLAFYRRNPELMKRYFPQLYKEEMAKEQKSEEVPAPPKE